MEAYVTEEQQVEAIKKWFNKYGSVLSWVIIAILSVILVAKYWFHHKEVVFQRASDAYAVLQQALDRNDPVTINNQADELIKQHPDSPYATFAALELANKAIQDNNYDASIKQLEWVINHAKQADFRSLARIRLMRLFISQDKLPEALALYDEQKARSYLPIMFELKGDILYKQNDEEGARKAYEKALEAAPKEQMAGFLLKLKLEELGIDPNKMLSDKETKATKS